jgi:hypothetical protein
VNRIVFPTNFALGIVDKAKRQVGLLFWPKATPGIANAKQQKKTHMTQKLFLETSL